MVDFVYLHQFDYINKNDNIISAQIRQRNANASRVFRQFVKSKRRGKKTKYNNCIKSVTKSQHLAFGNFFSSEYLQQAFAQFLCNS
jgi:hypothetical protein